MTAVSRGGFARRHNGYWFDRFICDGSRRSSSGGFAFLEVACVLNWLARFSVVLCLLNWCLPTFLVLLVAELQCKCLAAPTITGSKLSTGETHSSWARFSSESHSHQCAAVAHFITRLRCAARSRHFLVLVNLGCSAPANTLSRLSFWLRLWLSLRLWVSVCRKNRQKCCLLGKHELK